MRGVSPPQAGPEHFVHLGHELAPTSPPNVWTYSDIQFDIDLQLQLSYLFHCQLVEFPIKIQMYEILLRRIIVSIKSFLPTILLLFNLSAASVLAFSIISATNLEATDRISGSL